MAIIKINDTQLDATISKAVDRLTLTLTNTALPLDELAALFDPGATPEVRVVDDAGLTTAIYSNRRVIEVSAQLDGGDVRRAAVALQVEPLEQSAADRLGEQIERQAAMIAQHQTRIETQAEQIDAQAGMLSATKAAARMAVAANADTMRADEIDAVRDLFDCWEMGMAYAADRDIVRYGTGDLLYICRQSHIAQDGWKPGAAGTENLWTCIDKTHAGTEDAPIPYAGNMTLEEGKCYSQDNVVYRCTRDTQIPVFQTLAELVGVYVEVAEATK